MRSRYQDIKAYIKHLNTAQGHEEIKNAEHQPEWIIEVPQAHQPTAAIFDVGHLAEREANFQNRRSAFTEIISPSLDQDPSSEASSDALILYEDKENKARVPRPQMSEATPLAFKPYHANAMGVAIKEIASTVPASPCAPGSCDLAQCDHLTATFDQLRASDFERAPQQALNCTDQLLDTRCALPVAEACQDVHILSQANFSDELAVKKAKVVGGSAQNIRKQTLT